MSCHVSPCKAINPLKLQLPTLLWLPDGGGVCVPMDPLSLDLSPTLVKPVDPGELTFTLYLAIFKYLSDYLSEYLSMSINIYLNI